MVETIILTNAPFTTDMFEPVQPEPLDWKAYARAGKKIAALKEVRRRFGIGMAEAKWMVDGYVQYHETWENTQDGT